MCRDIAQGRLYCRSRGGGVLDDAAHFISEATFVAPDPYYSPDTDLAGHIYIMTSPYANYVHDPTCRHAEAQSLKGLHIQYNCRESYVMVRTP